MKENITSKLVAVGSRNPVKIEAVKIAFTKLWPQTKWQVEGIDVSSGVSNQPLSDSETLLGARNRAKTALLTLSADFGLGIEGGLHQLDNLWFDSAWIVALRKDGIQGIGSSIRMLNSDKMIDMVLNQKFELGQVDDILFNKTNSKQNDGHFGLMTDGQITRTSAYIDAVISALARFIHPEIF